MNAPTRVMMRRGALVTVEETAASQIHADTETLTAAIRANVTHAYGAAAADSFARAVAAAAW